MRNRKMRKMTHSIKATRGMTLIELSVVLLILVALAGMTLPYLSGTTSTAVCTTTDTTLAGIRDSILGTGAIAGFKNDLGMMPTFYDNGNSSDLYYRGILSELYNITPATGSPSFPTYSVTTQHGWNGPYLTNGVNCTNSPKRISLCNNYCSTATTPPLGSFAVDSYPVGLSQQYCYNGAPSSASVTGAFQVVDPIELRQDNSTPPIYFLVSGGRNGQIETLNALATRHNDDRVLVLIVPDPGANAPCNQ